MSIINPSKGVNYYAYVAKSDYSVIFKAPTDWGEKHDKVTFESDKDMEIKTKNFEISESDIGITEHTGRFEWEVKNASNDTILNRYVEVAPFTGNVADTNIKATLDQNAVLDDNYSICYGFYDASSGYFSGLTNHDQSYVYVTQNLQKWMRDIVDANAHYGECPFDTFALAGSHDAGMYDNSIATRLFTEKQYSNFLLSPSHGIQDEEFEFMKKIFDDAQEIAGNYGVDVIVNLGMTQKDGIQAQLNLGIRYFDIRPGFCSYANDFVKPKTVLDATSDEYCNLYHQHKFIPGRHFDHLLSGIVDWLLQNPTEIVVVSLNFQGFLFDNMKPSISYLNEYVNSLTAKSDIKSGNQSDLCKSYNVLLKNKIRLIFLNQIDDQKTDARKYDSYQKSLYETTEAKNIIEALNQMGRVSKSSYDYTVLQLQGTANAIIPNDLDSSITFNHRTSPLMSTKAMFDTKTYAWLLEKVVDTFNENQLIVFLNDFADNALVHHGMVITKKRMDKYLKALSS